MRALEISSSRRRWALTGSMPPSACRSLPPIGAHVIAWLRQRPLLEDGTLGRQVADRRDSAEVPPVERRRGSLQRLRPLTAWRTSRFSRSTWLSSTGGIVHRGRGVSIEKPDLLFDRQQAAWATDGDPSGDPDGPGRSCRCHRHRALWQPVRRLVYRNIADPRCSGRGALLEQVNFHRGADTRRPPLRCGASAAKPPTPASPSTGAARCHGWRRFRGSWPARRGLPVQRRSSWAVRQVTRQHHLHRAPRAANARRTRSSSGVLDDRSRGVFRASSCPSRRAEDRRPSRWRAPCCCRARPKIDAKPELEIYADDVICAHGATVGELDHDALFYLTSRGLPDETARAMLIEAFLTEAESRPSRRPLPGLLGPYRRGCWSAGWHLVMDGGPPRIRR